MTPRKPTGIRVSARLRGTAVEEDEWQEVPDEWLATSDTHRGYVKDAPSGPSPASKIKMKTGLESEDSSISELTELTDGEDDSARAEQDFQEGPLVEMEEMDPTLTGKDTDAEIEDQQHGEADVIDPSVMPLPPDDFVEWETVSGTRKILQDIH